MNLAPAPNIKIYQICHDAITMSKVEPGFLKLDWTHNPHPEFREFAVFRYAHLNFESFNTDLLGMLSPKFKLKAGLTGHEFIEWVQNNPGYDAYFVNPFPQHAYYSFNVWEHGVALFGDEFLEACQEINMLADSPFKIDTETRHTHHSLAFSSYWVGNRTFWRDYISRVEMILNVPQSRLTERSRRVLFEPQARVPKLGMVGRIPHFLERTLTAFIHDNPTINALGYPVTSERIRDRCVAVIDRLIYDSFASLIDSWDNQKSFGPDERTYFKEMSLVYSRFRYTYFKYNTWPYADFTLDSLNQK